MTERVWLQKRLVLPPDATFDDYLAVEIPADEVESTPIDMSLASMQDAGKGADKAAPSEVGLFHSVCLLWVLGIGGQDGMYTTQYRVSRCKSWVGLASQHAERWQGRRQGCSL